MDCLLLKLSNKEGSSLIVTFSLIVTKYRNYTFQGMELLFLSVPNFHCYKIISSTNLISSQGVTGYGHVW